MEQCVNILEQMKSILRKWHGSTKEDKYIQNENLYQAFLTQTQLLGQSMNDQKVFEMVT